MKFKFKAKFLSLLLTFAMLLGCSTFVAAQEDESLGQNIEIIFTDVTDKRADVLEGEAKIMVSVAGVEGIASIVQTALTFEALEGNPKYKSITFLQGENNPPDCVLVTPNAALVNSKKVLIPSIISTDKSINLSGTTDLFILTFEGEPGDDTTVAVVRIRARHPVNLVIGPPATKDQDIKMMNLFFAKEGE